MDSGSPLADSETNVESVAIESETDMTTFATESADVLLVFFEERGL